MIRIEYYSDPTTGGAEVYDDVVSVSDWICGKFETREEVLDLRFFKGDILGEEIPHTEILDQDELCICVIHDSKLPKETATWVYLAISLIFSVVTIALTPKPKIPNTTGRDQESATNSLGSANNEPGLNQRIDDIFGTVNKHTPKLWQLPYRIGVNNTEVEVLYLGVGRGKYQVDDDEVFDGDTPVKRIQNASYLQYGPNTSPLSGDSPELQIGPGIDEPLGIYRQSNELNPSELLPPNDLNITNVTWLLTGTSSTVGTIDVDTSPEGFDCRNYYEVGQTILLEDIFRLVNPVSTLLFSEPYTSPGVPPDFITVDLYEKSSVDLGSETYQISSVSENSITVDLSQNSQAIVDEWLLLSEFSPYPKTYNELALVGQALYTLDEQVEAQLLWYKDGDPWGYEYRLDARNPTVDTPFDNSIGYFTIPSSVTQIILNFVSLNGFLKYISNNETSVYAEVQIQVRELDASGTPTGNVTNNIVTHESNSDNLSGTVFQTHRINVDQYEFKEVLARRITNRDKDEEVSNNDNIEWRDLYFFEPVDVTEFGDATSAHVTIPSNSASRLIKERKINLNLTRLVTQYLGNGTFGPTESYATDQFDQILVHTALDPFIGRLQLNEFNADGFLERKQEILDYYGVTGEDMCRFGYDFDDTEITYQDTFSLINNVVDCIPYHQLGVYDCYFEKLQAESSLIVTHRNKYRGSETRTVSFTDAEEYDGVELSYRSNESGIQDTIYIPDDQSAVNPERIEIPGVTSKLQAWRKAWRFRNKQLYERVVVKFDCDEYGRMVVPGSRIDSPDSTRFTKRMNAESGYRIYDGEIVEVNGLVVELSQPVEFTEGEDHYIQFTKSDGTNSEQIMCEPGDNEFMVVLTATPSEALYDGYSRDRTKYTFASEQARFALPLLVKTIGYKIEDGMETNTITSVNYSDEYYSKDQETP